MKHTYLTLCLLLVSVLSFGQSVIVTVDRPNIIGPTDSGNAIEISSSGFERGAGIDLASPNANNFTSSQWQATSQAEAVTNDEYIQWSVSASSINSVEITELNIRLRQNSNDNGPDDWQIFYSLDNFNTPGIALTDALTVPTSGTNFTLNNTSPGSAFPIDSGTDGTITFRLYAWNATTNGGWLRIPVNTSWADFGITDPGMRIFGNITTTAVNSTESNIAFSSFGTQPTDINYTAYSVSSGLTTGNALKIGEFVIQDGGDDSDDTDALSTFLTEISFNIDGYENIAALAIFDGATNLAETTVNFDNASFAGFSVEATDNSSKTFDVYATFNSTVTDNEQIVLTISSASADVGVGSGFTVFDAGGASTSTDASDNRIEVTVSQFAFDQQPTDSNQFQTMSPAPTILAVDSNNNLDEDYTSSVDITSTIGTLAGSPITYSILNGVAELNTISYNDQVSGASLIAIDLVGPYVAVSDPFNIIGPLITIAQQDFDGSSPEWTYSNDIPFFDNGWGIDGYYGLIDIADAAPLDNSNFSGNILGENDLNDEGDNGTNSWATITFSTIDVSNFDNVKVSFDWQVIGYAGNGDDAQYRLILDGVNQPRVFLLDGNGDIDDDGGSVSLDIPENTNTVALEIRVRNNGLVGFSGFDNFKITSDFEGLLYTSNAWIPNPPSETTDDQNVLVLDGTYVVGTNIDVKNFVVANGATTTVSLGQSITANGGVVNRGTLEMESASSSYSSLISTNNVIGEVIYNRHVNQLADTGSITGNNDLIAAPVTSDAQDFLVLRTANPDLPSGTIGGVPSFLFGPFDRDTNEYINFTAANDSDPIESGIGYRTASTAIGGSTFTFTGEVVINQPPIAITVGTGTDFNLIGNPYPSYITLSGFLAANNSEFAPASSGVYGYDGDATDGFQIWNQAYADANPNAIIAPGQGFFVASQVGGGSISFPSDIRSNGTADDFIPGRLANINTAHVKLKIANDHKQYFTDIYFNDNASSGMDSGYDSAIFDLTPEFAIYSQLVDNNEGLDLGVQTLGYDFTSNIIIPLGIKANQGEQITISIEQSDIPDGVTIYLEDTLNNTFTLLNESDFILTPVNNLNDIGRFFLRFEEDTLSITESDLETIQVYTTSNPKELVVSGTLKADTEIDVYDIQGRIVLNRSLDSSLSTQTIDIVNLTAGVYILNLRSKVNNRSIKVIVK